MCSVPTSKYNSTEKGNEKYSSEIKNSDMRLYTKYSSLKLQESSEGSNEINSLLKNLDKNCLQDSLNSEKETNSTSNKKCEVENNYECKIWRMRYEN